MSVLTVHDDSVLSRTAYLIEERKRNIELYRNILNGTCKKPEYYNVNRDAVVKALDAEQWLLDDLLEDIAAGLFERELRDIWERYIRKEEMEGIK